MKRQTMIALAVAIVFGLFAVYLLNSYLSRTDRRVQVAERGMTKVAVAAVPLDYGTPLTSDKVKLVDFPSASIPAGSFRTYAEMVPPGKQRLVLRPITVNEPILQAINNNLVAGRNIDWINMWRELSGRFTDSASKEKFDDYIPPYKNLGAIFIRAYKEKMDN